MAGQQPRNGLGYLYLTYEHSKSRQVERADLSDPASGAVSHDREPTKCDGQDQSDQKT